MTTPTRHVRLNGWCRRCDGAGRSAVEHVDVTVTDVYDLQAVWDVEDVEQVWTAVLRMIAKHVHEQATRRLADIQNHGCEAGAARAHEQGRLQVVERDMWEALGLPVPADVGGELW